MTTTANPPKLASSEHVTDKDAIVLRSYYEQAMKRIMHEYDQRDRDFATHVTINAGLFAAAGVALQWIKLVSPTSWLATGLVVLALSFFGVKTAKALIESVRSFTYWQRMMNGLLADIETRILPSDLRGIYQRVEAVGGRPEGVDLVETREALASALNLVWRILFWLSVVVVLLAGAALFVPNIAACVRTFFA